jgi:hypothetical protein
MTFWYKRVFPVIWFGSIVLLLVVPLFAGSSRREPLAFLLPPTLMAIFGYFLMKRLVFDLVDEVLDAGDALVVRNTGIEDRVALADIINVSYTQLSSPPRVTLSMRSPSRFGDQITFCAPVRFSPLAAFSPSPIIDELIKRIDAARQRRRR